MRVLPVLAAAKQQERLFDEHVRVRVHHVAPDIPGSGIVSATSPAGNVAGVASLFIEDLRPLISLHDIWTINRGIYLVAHPSNTSSSAGAVTGHACKL